MSPACRLQGTKRPRAAITAGGMTQEISAPMLNADYCEIQVGGPRAKKRGIALVDHADADAVRAYSWYMLNKGYAIRTTRLGGKRLALLMHREILGLTPGDGVHVDHVNGDKLDNRRTNLRICTHAQNLQNRHNLPHRGATWHTRDKRWVARAGLDGKRHHLGRFATQEEAAAVAAAFRREHMPFSADARETAA